jgi:squalene-hopene/tetraprenyl-beta-curcumene cyclase
MARDSAAAARASAAQAAVRRAQKILLTRQDAEGCWPGLSAEDITIEAEYLLLLEFLSLRSAAQTSAIAQQLRSRQHADGSWSGGEVSASVLAYLALRLAGDSADAYHLAVAAGWIRDAGGLAATSASCQAWLAVFGMTEWEDLHVPAPEGFFLPARHGDWAGLCRQSALSVAILGTLRTVRRLPLDLAELRSSAGPASPDRRFRLRVPPVSLARSAEAAVLRKCGQWVIDWQQREGLPSYPRPVWAGSLAALHALGYPVRHPVLADGLAWLDAVTARPRLAAGQLAARRPPVADTVLAVEALADAGAAAGDTVLVGAGRWLLGERITGPPDGPGPALAGWSFRTDGYPSVAGTAQVLIALSRVKLAGRAAIDSAVRWLTGIQSRDGSWSGSALVTALVVQALAGHGQAEGRAVRRGVVWLLLAQQPDGSWPARKGEPGLLVTASVLAALLAAGVRPVKPVVVTAAGWLLDRQNADAGWSSGDRDEPDAADPGGRGPRQSDPPGTAQAVLALLATGLAAGRPAVDNGVGWLVAAQQADGGWGERPPGRSGPRRRPALSPGLVLPLSALGRYLTARAAPDPTGAAADRPLLVSVRLSDPADTVPATGD